MSLRFQLIIHTVNVVILDSDKYWIQLISDIMNGRNFGSKQIE